MRRNQSADVGAALNPATAKTTITAQERIIPRSTPKVTTTPWTQRWSRMSQGTANIVRGRCPITAMLKNKTYKAVSGEENSPDDDALIIPKKHLEQEGLHKRLITTVGSLKKQKQRLKAAQDTLNHRWNKVLDTGEKYGGNCHTKSYPKCKLLPEFDDEAIEPIPPKNNMTDLPDRPPRGRDRAANDAAHKSAHDLH